MTREQTKQKIVQFLGGSLRLVEYVNSNAVPTGIRNPRQIGQVLGDYRPHGGITVVGYEDGKFWDDDGYPMPAAPNAWAPIPEGALA